MKRPSKQKRRRLGEYVRWVADAIELRDWTFTINRALLVDDDALAKITCTYGRKLARIELTIHFWRAEPDEQRHIVCHELIHAHLQPTSWNLNNIADHVSRREFAMLEDGHKDAIEFATDALAAALAKHMPLPKLNHD